MSACFKSSWIINGFLNPQSTIALPVLRPALTTAHNLKKVKNISRAYKYKITCCWFRDLRAERKIADFNKLPFRTSAPAVFLLFLKQNNENWTSLAPYAITAAKSIKIPEDLVLYFLASSCLHTATSNSYKLWSYVYSKVRHAELRVSQSFI